MEKLIVYGLAIWRVSSLFVNEKGPWNVFLRLRILAGIQHDDNGTAYGIPDTFLAGVLSCIWCCSVWVGFFWTALWLVSSDTSLKLAVPFAFSALAILIDSWMKK